MKFINDLGKLMLRQAREFPSDEAYLKEDGCFLLKEDGDALLLE